MDDKTYAGLIESMKVMTIPHAMVIAGNAYLSGSDMAENAALLAMLIAEKAGGNMRVAADTAWNAANAIEKDRW